MSKSLIVSGRFLSALKIVLALSVLSTIGCATYSSAPLYDSGSISPQLQNTFENEYGVSITVKSSAWYGSPIDLERYVTPFYVEIQNGSDKTLIFSHEDIALFDENRTQYNALSPQRVADILRATPRSRYAHRPFSPSLSIGIGGGYYSDSIGAAGYSPLWRSHGGSSRAINYEDVFTQALIPGLVHPDSKLQGFAYFQKIAPQVRQLTLELGYKIEGEDKYHRLSFSFDI